MPCTVGLGAIWLYLPARAERAVEDLELTLSRGDVARARKEIIRQLGTVTVEADEREIRLYSEFS